MEKIVEIIDGALDKLNKGVELDFSKWTRTGEVLDVVDCYDWTEVVESDC